MAGEVLMFLVAVSVGIYLYQTLIYAQDSILISSENYSREAEHTAIDVDTVRKVKKDEVILTIINMIESTNTFEASEVIVKDGGHPLKYSILPQPSDETIDDKKKELRNIIARDGLSFDGEDYERTIESGPDGKNITVIFNKIS